MTEIQSIAVFCGSKFGVDPIFGSTAREVGRQLADNGIELVYGGGNVGLMGAVADGAIERGGRVTGVMPKALADREIAHTGLDRLVIVDSMHERKAAMAELASGFVALPGGAGTLEEISEQWTWAQLGIHAKPCGFLNINGFYDSMRDFADRMTFDGFVEQRHRDMVIFSSEISDLIARFQAYVPPAPKWTETPRVGEPPIRP
jgi:uncharacterized protein (TIGR00730 family)